MGDARGVCPDPFEIDHAKSLCTLRAMARQEKRTHDTTAEKLDWLDELRREARHAGSEKSVAKHREAGKLLARERAEKLCDPGSLVVLERYVWHR